MCTVTYLPVKDGVIITSNRDEKQLRARALPPRHYNLNGSTLLFPRDPEAGGTWIAMHENGAMGVLLNGGWQKHTPVYPYRRSRGLVFLDIMAAPNFQESFERIDLCGIEPFTLVLFAGDSLLEARWDGERKYMRTPAADKAHIWSSVTLYEEDAIRQRERWFNAWLSRHPGPNATDIQLFHQFGGEGDSHNDLRMNRNGSMLTVSITCMLQTSEGSKMFYTDLVENLKYQVPLAAYQVVPEIPT